MKRTALLLALLAATAACSDDDDNAGDTSSPTLSSSPTAAPATTEGATTTLASEPTDQTSATSGRQRSTNTLPRRSATTTEQVRNTTTSPRRSTTTTEQVPSTTTRSQRSTTTIATENTDPSESTTGTRPPRETTTTAPRRPRSTTTAPAPGTPTTLVVTPTTVSVTSPDKPPIENRNNPIAFGNTAALNEDWSVRIEAVDLDAAQELVEFADFNPVPAEGSRAVLITIHGTNESDALALPAFDPTLVNRTIEAESGDIGCGVIPNSLYDLNELEPGEEFTANVCVVVPETMLGDGLVLRLRQAEQGGKVFALD